jgi:excisionase family DNA binding protein
MELFSDALNEIETFTNLQRLTWGLSEVSESRGLSLVFLRAEVRAGRLPVRRFGRRVLVRDEDLKTYLSNGSERETKNCNE